MLNRLRFAKMMLGALPALRRGGEPTTRSSLRFRVRWADCDINRHMNNARYLALMDIGRWDLVLRTGLLQAALRQKTNPVVVEVHIAFRKELRPGTPFTLETELAGLEGRKLWFVQRFLKPGPDGEPLLAAVADVGVLLLGAGRVLSAEASRAFLESVGLELPTLAAPPRASAP